MQIKLLKKKNQKEVRKRMDDYILKQTGYLIVTVLGAIFIALGALIVDLQLKPYWITMIMVIMGAVEVWLIAVIRYKFKIPEEEPEEEPEVSPVSTF